MPFIELTGQEFLRLRKLASKAPDYMVMFRAEWCGYCKEALPKFKEAASESSILFVSVEQEEIKAIEQDKNFQKDFEIIGYPTMYFISGRKAPIKYSGERTKQAFLTYVQQ